MIGEYVKENKMRKDNVMRISDFTIICDDCGRKYRISSDSLDVDYVCSERQMGTEVQHIFYGEKDCQCGNRLLYTVTAVEYPEGTYNFHTCESSGCTYIEKPSAEMEYNLPEKGLVTTSHFTRGAVVEAQRLNGRIRLIDFDELCRLMQ